VYNTCWLPPSWKAFPMTIVAKMSTETKKTTMDGIFTALVVSRDIDATLGRFSVNDSVNLS